MKRKKKNYARPKKPFEKERIAEENQLMKKYALKNKKEVWKAQAKINYFRRRAKDLAKSSTEEQEVLFGKLKYIGINVNSIVDVLALKVEDILNRRLPTIVAKKKIANTPQHARQMVSHKLILINGKAVNSPSYIVPVSEEDQITRKPKKEKKPVVEEKPAEAEALATESSEGEAAPEADAPAETPAEEAPKEESEEKPAEEENKEASE